MNTAPDTPPVKAAPAAPVTAPDIMARKGQDKICCITAYDYSSGMIADGAGVDIVLVGDSLAMVVLGHEDTLSVTMDEMVHHTLAASRGVKRALLVADMPFMSFCTVERALKNAGRLMAQGRARAVKLEGGVAVAPQIRALVEAGVPVMGHVGLTPQHIARFGGFKAQGKSAEAARALIDDAQAVEEAGAFSVVLEAMPVECAQLITEALTIPTIGIGAGEVTDGQILVYHDVLGLFDRFVPRFVRCYAELGEASRQALAQYCDDVRRGRFPGDKNTLYMPEDQVAQVRKIKVKKKR
ncbi:MAG: 3-methyl-2-oxobutanoate hydroxymethyltransferase [Pseudodesulfovibrio sp.]|uniref:3-methyl-2-oxobutanoate hydroxymethyltransferase n=1 Tax=Pseudodesulfovibrio aespoeensis (strain ATCC 700646 / DSM 10631 / Aspo-2) TaxID=643562 RepID=E6VV69_PSEA9|nr:MULTISPECIES: 3-methyl-2-oxobutanoate hydroxymethyltransferase [Pseudodesulfovibrio]MBU4191387.1 3-methyl-2-oxobutanoate hydroxymethyltransferase [Pseudomonadota bacterium]ADU61220.1 3-methyl-2-oxobutanoate hydroxymethyltransferase [Pseudodesulfovibrio aespoeensis Aspo-2]MBU4244029.1 3-methyl-2-oxobutanoate hydroxymethyltransferase [Pseudomonadota bacterium]MBU4378307.1 3-methyl-2-oxobutanoate hydroxymethyltransferase [Pseudomonadota bacterium]MBU4474278.1 3-methyl-2-oxobutanoate hydroxymet